MIAPVLPLLLVVPTSAPTLPLLPQPPPIDRALFGLGINLSGLEFKADRLPGVPFQDYFPVEPQILDYYVAKGFRYVRLPFRWERLQPELDGELDADYLALIESSVELMIGRNLVVTLDCHNFGARVEGVLGGSVVTAEHLADLWIRLSKVFRHAPAGRVAYDLMNQPVHAWGWARSAQIVINAVRMFDRTTPIVVQGCCWSGAGNWQVDNHDFLLICPVGRLTVSAHVFPDEYENGIDLRWKHQLDFGLTEDIMVDRTRGFVAWCKEHGYRPQIAQFGVGNDHPGWNATLDKFLAFCQRESVSVIAWVGGRLPDAYAMSLEPRPDGSDAAQMATLVGRMTLGSTPVPQVKTVVGPARHGRYDAYKPRFLGYDFDRFRLERLTVVRYGVAGHYVTRLMQPRIDAYVVLPSTFMIDDMVPNMEKAAYAMPDGTPFDEITVPAPPPRKAA